MSCDLKNIAYPDTVTGETWAGLNFSIDSSDDTEFANTLSRVRMSFKNAAGTVSLTLDSNTAGQITIDSATAYAWEFTVESRTMTLTEGWYSWAVETTDSESVKDKDFLAGTINILADPHA